MLRDLTKEDWLSILNLPEHRIPKVLILRGTRNLKTQYQRYHGYFSNVTEITPTNGLLEDIFVAELSGVPIGYASVYGAPMASEVVHVFGVLGTSLVLHTGCCGALAPDIRTGDLFICIEAYCGDGASSCYKPGRKKIVRASFNACQLPSIQKANDITLHLGRIYTTSALFAEGRKQVEDWFRKGCLAADMETSAVFAVAEHFQMDRLAILYVFDNPRYEGDIIISNCQKNKNRAFADKRMIELTLDIAKMYCKEKK